MGSVATEDFELIESSKANRSRVVKKSTTIIAMGACQEWLTTRSALPLVVRLVVYRGSTSEKFLEPKLTSEALCP